ncbi:MAG: T9SS type A sorting domain-containing protein [Bacteroidia bacterium]
MRFINIKSKKSLCFLIAIASFINLSFSQTLLNGNLDGNLNGNPFGFTVLPDYWQAVSPNDPVCLAIFGHAATPDLTNSMWPSVQLGVIGNPYSPPTFVSGEHAISNNGGAMYHEGIRQTMDSLIPGAVYTISFYQAVVKCDGVLDSSGSWIVYYDTTLIAVTTPTFSNAPFNSLTFPWEFRQVSFTATDSIHTLKFLPYDDDNDQNALPFGRGLRMGIDNISFILTALSVNDNILAENIILYPVPATENINISFPQKIKEGKIELYDLLGKNTGTYFFQDTDFVKIDLKNHCGMYLCKITCGNLSVNKKIIFSCN